MSHQWSTISDIHFWMGARKRNVKSVPATKNQRKEADTADTSDKRDWRRIIFLVTVIVCCGLLCYVQLDVASKIVQTGKFRPGPAIVTTWKGLIFEFFEFFLIFDFFFIFSKNFITVQVSIESGPKVGFSITRRSGSHGCLFSGIRRQPTVKPSTGWIMIHSTRGWSIIMSRMKSTSDSIGCQMKRPITLSSGSCLHTVSMLKRRLQLGNRYIMLLTRC